MQNLWSSSSSMNLQTSVLLLVVTTVCMNNALLVSRAQKVNQLYKNCNTTQTCGSQIITFPFFLNGQQQPYCGHPSFKLSCDDPVLSLSISGDSYTINSIAYPTRTIRVSNAAFAASVGRYGPCIPPFQNLSLPEADLSLRPNQRKVFLLFGCNYTARLSGSGTQEKCQSNDYQVLALSDDFETRLSDVSELCGGTAAVEAPVLAYNSGVVNLTAAVEAGLELTWDAGLSTKCGACRGSGGICGSDNETSSFMCYCVDGPISNGSCHDIIVPTPAPAPAPAPVDIASPILPPTPAPRQYNGEPKALIIKTGVPIGSIVVVSALSVGILCLLRKKKLKQTKLLILSKLKELGSPQIILYSYSDIKKMKKPFSEQSLGNGGYGDVFKGVLQDKTFVAVKMLKPPKTEHTLGKERPNDIDRGLDNFVKEVTAFRAASHKNVVKLLGFCYESGLWFETIKRAIVLEFMDKGSLDKYLGDKSGNSEELDFGKRYEISIGIAEGLKYLHHDCNTQIVHYDIKPGNVLLNGKFEPKISDFGLANSCSRESSLGQGPKHGTYGYMAPEHGNSSNAPAKYDVYSYGMTVLEIMNLRKPNNTEAEGIPIVHFPDQIYQRLEDLKSTSVNDGQDQDMIEKERKMIIVSLKCIQYDYSARPTMREVSNMLAASVDSLGEPPMPYEIFSPRSTAPPESATKYFSISMQNNTEYFST